MYRFGFELGKAIAAYLVSLAALVAIAILVATPQPEGEGIAAAVMVAAVLAVAASGYAMVTLAGAFGYRAQLEAVDDE